MNRRQFTYTLAGIACLPHLARNSASAIQTKVTDEQAREIFRRAIVIDALASPGSANVPIPPRGPLNKEQLNNVINS
ncbi:MAG TPA: hypothetical protein VEV81_11175, partial [Pyrinomonadaceae bacterium]|nr:hypothetical protein [Pyrinomonadaceae bacterium]